MFLGIDCGTQGTKALMVNAEGAVLGRGYARHQLIERPTGAREQDPQWWIDAMRASVHQAVSKSGQTVLALSISGQQHGLVVLDNQERVIRPAKLWNDTETAAQNERLIARFGGADSFRTRFGILPMTGYTVSKLLWLKEIEPDNFRRIRHILLPHEYLNFWLTGKACAEFGDASGTAFFDVRTRSWIGEILDEIDDHTGHLVSCLPSLIGSEEIIGTLLPDIAAELGLNPACVVASGGGDNMMGAIGTGNVREGIVTMSLGTSSTIYSYRESLPQQLSKEIAPFCSSTGGWLPLVCTMNATNVVSQALQLAGMSVTDIDDALRATQPGASGITFLPFLNGERTPDLPEAKGALFGLSATNFSANNLIRASIEGVTFGILNGLRSILPEQLADTIQVIGGGSRSTGWRQLLADATGATIHVPIEEEAGCLGAAIQAMYAFLHWQKKPMTFSQLTENIVKIDSSKTTLPNAELREKYAAAWARFNSILAREYPSVQLYNQFAIS